MLSNMANVNTDHSYLVYQRNKYQNIPLWILVNTLTFGQISKMFTFLPQKLRITKTGTTYDKGKDDLFAVVIGLRYLLSRDDFAIFKKKLIAIIKGYGKKSNRLTENELLELMGFPVEWKSISRYGL